MSVRIHCINKSGGHHQNPHEAIEYLGWIKEETNETARSTRLEVYKFVTEQNGVAFVRDSYGNVAYLRGNISAAGNPYVQTVADGKWTDNLLALPECR